MILGFQIFHNFIILNSFEAVIYSDQVKVVSPSRSFNFSSGVENAVGSS